MKSRYILALIALVLFISGCKDNSEGQASLNEQLLAACSGNSGQAKDITRLISKGADVNVKSDNGLTPLHFASNKSEDSGVVLALLNAGANVNAKSPHGVTPLCIATGIRNRGSWENILHLIDAGADVNVNCSWRYVGGGNSNTYSPLMCALTQPDKHFTSKEQRAIVIKKLIDAGSDIHLESDGLSAIHFSCMYEHSDASIVNLLLDAGANVNKRTLDRQNTPLMYASGFTNVDLISLLIKKSVNIRSRNNAGLDAFLIAVATKKDNPEVIQLFLDENINPSAVGLVGLTALHIATTEFKPKTISLLIERGANVNAQDESGNTPLNDMHTYRYRNSPEIVRLLIEAGAQVNIRDKSGKSYLSNLVLASVSTESFPQILRMLVKAGVDLESKDKNGCTPLGHAAQQYNGLLSNRIDPIKDQKTVCLHLLNAGANVNAQDKYGSTPLMKAVVTAERHAKHKQTDHQEEELKLMQELVSMLLDHGADISLKKNGETVLDYAKESATLYKTDIYWTLHDASFE